MADADSIDQRVQAAAERAIRLGYAISKRLVVDPLPYSLRTDSRLALDQLEAPGEQS